MPNHKKFPIFLRITTSKDVICINPHQLSSFQIVSQAPVRVVKDTNERANRVTPPEQVVTIKADTIAFFFPAGTSMTFSAGVEITQDEFTYVCATLIEYLYMSEPEWRAKNEELAKAKMAEWNRISKENEAAL